MGAPSSRAPGLDARRILTPPPLYRPAPFWSWNEVMEQPDVRRQVAELARGGMGGAFIHARGGLITPYMGADYMDAVAAALDEARSRGLCLSLYDEDRWPSGWAGGAVPLRAAAFRAKWLLRVPAGDAPPTGENVSLLARDARGARYYRYVSPLGQSWFNGTTYADVMDRNAMRAFLETAYDPYARRFGADFGALIPAIFTDEPSVAFPPAYDDVPRGMLFWTDEMPARFRAMHGYDLLPHVAELFEDVGAYRATRTDYYRTCAWLFEHHFSAQLGAWCRAHDIALTGHYLLEGSLAATLACGVCTLPHYRHMDWPGIDHLGRQVEEVITGLGCRSVVNQYAKPRMMSELYGAAGQHLSFEDRKWIAEQQIVLGVNLLVPHLLLYTMAGERKRDHPCNMWYQQPWWPLNHVVDDYLARLCALMAQGAMTPELLVLHPQESLYPARRPPSPEQSPWDMYRAADEGRIAPLDDGFQRLSHALLGRQRLFDYGDETILADVGRVEGDGTRPLLRVGAMSYPLVVLPALTSVRATTLALLEEFAAAGGPIVSAGALPTLIDGRDDGAGRLRRFLRRHVRSCAPEEVGSVLDRLFPPLVAVDVAGPRQWLWQHTRHVGDAHVVLLVNLSRQERIVGTLRLSGMKGPLTRLDLIGGTRHVLVGARGGLSPIPLALEPGESAVFMAGPADLTPFVPAPPAPRVERAQRLDGWRVERLDENALTLDQARVARGDGPLGPLAPVIAAQHLLNEERYDGPLTLRYPFVSDLDAGGGGGRRLRLIVERPERCTIRVNGAHVAYAGLPPWRDRRWLPIDIAHLVRRGENTIEVAYPEFRHGDATSVADQARRYGTEIEAVYLVGDFAVATYPRAGLPHATSRADETILPTVAPAAPGVVEPPAPTPAWTSRAVEGPFTVTTPQTLSVGDLVDQGLPFYAGRVACHARVTLLSPLAERVWLEVDRLTAPVVAVQVNGREAGTLAWRPYRVEITSLLHEGENAIALILYHSLRNLLGPHHGADGEPYWVGPHSFIGRGEGWARRLARGEQVAGWRWSYTVTAFGLLGDVRLLRSAES